MARVLLVEDDPLLSRGIVAALSVQGYSVDAALRGKAALTMANDQPYAIIILDIGLPDISGLDVLRKLRAGGHTEPVLILTARVGNPRIRPSRAMEAPLLQPTNTCSIDTLPSTIQSHNQHNPVQMRMLEGALMVVPRQAV